MTASSAPTATVSSSPTTILVRVPEAGDGISVSTLSVETSSSGSSAWTWSPSCLSHRVTVPSLTLSPSAGMVTEVDIGSRAPSRRAVGLVLSESAVRVQRLAGQAHVCLADGLGLGGVGVDQVGDVVGVRLPAVDELRLADQLPDPRPDH